MKREYIITVTYDPEYKLYSARCEDLPGMFVDCSTLEELVDVVPWAVESLLNDDKQTEIEAIPLYMMEQVTESRAH